MDFGECESLNIIVAQGTAATVRQSQSYINDQSFAAAIGDLKRHTFLSGTAYIKTHRD